MTGLRDDERAAIVRDAAAGAGLLLDTVERIKADADRAARAEVLGAVVEVFNDLHHTYANTTACWGGVGGQAITPHCAVNCDNPKHEKAQEAWRNVVRASQGDPAAMAALGLRHGHVGDAEPGDLGGVERRTRNEWADYFEGWLTAVGPELLTVETVIAALRADGKPFGVAAADLGGDHA